ncbi:hypothetical protein GCM10011609_28980 [Lentzea pudingi]|uniref:Uncharacterized protein n=1 Tax=Lentzea pudingi TaxID=1789439 RepID=A0ABQ2HUC1_9PSEU|nr:hypothetical protein GCM10011609_28980 [Lentzea pudingi]
MRMEHVIDDHRSTTTVRLTEFFDFQGAALIDVSRLVRPFPRDAVNGHTPSADECVDRVGAVQGSALEVQLP